MSAIRGESNIASVAKFSASPMDTFRRLIAKEEDRYFGCWLDGILGPKKIGIGQLDGGHKPKVCPQTDCNKWNKHGAPINDLT